MKLKILSSGFQIIPDSSLDDERDIAFIETILGLREDGDSCKLVRRNSHGLSCIAYLETREEGFILKGGTESGRVINMDLAKAETEVSEESKECKEKLNE